jgi:hypothetical protein
MVAFRAPRNERVTVAIYNVLGQKITTLFDGSPISSQTTVRWEGMDARGRIVSSGSYLVVMNGRDRGVMTRRIVFVK